jgi:metallo-beta-lactamase family protein
MSNGGRIMHHERRYLSSPNNTILFVGYQAENSLGREILDGNKHVTIFDEHIAVQCHIKAIGGYSAHADQPKLLKWLKTCSNKPQRVFVVQGEEDQAMPLALKIQQQGIEALVPSRKNTVTL